MLDRLRTLVGRAFGYAGLVPHAKPPYLTRLEVTPQTILAAQQQGRRYPLRVDPEPFRRLAPELAAPHTWRAGAEPPVADGELAALFFAEPGMHKWPHYLRVYERTLQDLRTQPIRFLEIGVDRGGSLAVWSQYFGSGSTLVGIDLNPECAQYERASAGVHVRIGSQADPLFLASVVRDFGPFDVIVDDGSHFASHMIASFNCLFGEGLVGGGVYVAEDTQAGYWRHYRDDRVCFIDFAKGLVDDLHAEYQDETMDDGAFRVGAAERRKEVTVPSIARLLESVEFHNGMVIIRKAAKPRDLPASVRN